MCVCMRIYMCDILHRVHSIYMYIDVSTVCPGVYFGVQRKQSSNRHFSYSVIKVLATLFKSSELCSKTTNCSQTLLIAKWHLGGPLMNAFMAKWSIDDVSLGGYMILCLR